MKFATTLVSLASVATLAAASPWNTPTTTATSTTTITVTSTASGSTETGAGSCSTGPIQCCNSVESSSSPAGSLLLGLLGVVLQGVDVLLGLDCSPITVIGVGTGNSCNANVVCCQNNNVGGLISIGCVPIIL